MDLGSMLNTTSTNTDLDQEAISVYRRLSNGSASASPGQSPVVMEKKLLPRQDSDGFRAPDLPKPGADRLSTPGKRKIDQVDRDHQHGGDQTRIKSSAVPSSAAALPATSPATVPPPAPTRPIAPRPQIYSPYDGNKTINEITSLVKDALLYYLTADQRTYGKLGLEVEAKLGRIIDRDTGQRLHELFPIDSVVLLHHGYDAIRFESNMTNDQHAKFNKHLNDQVELRNPKHPQFDPSRPKMTYQHTHLTDETFPPITHNGIRLKPRVTTNDRDGSVVEIIGKENITHLHVLCPRAPFDIRLSINLEHALPAPLPEESSTSSSGGGGDNKSERKKDRLSYILPTHRIDLTKVSTGNRGGPGSGAAGGSFELEVELTDLDTLKRQADAAVDGRQNGFEELVAGFVGSVMRLNRIAADNFGSAPAVGNHDHPSGAGSAD